MAKPKDDDKPPEIDEHYFRELFDFGFNQLDAYMRRQREFLDYCVRRDAEQEDE